MIQPAENMTPGLEMLLRTKRSQKRHQTFSTRVVQRKWFSSSLFYSGSQTIYEDQVIHGNLKTPVCKQVLAILTSFSENVKLGRFVQGKISKTLKQ